MRLLSLLLLLLAGLPGRTAERPEVATTLLPIFCFTTAVAGEHLTVRSLLPPGVGPHDFQLTPKQRRQMEQARLILAHGMGVEPWLQRLRTSGGEPLPVVEVTGGLQPRFLTGSPVLDVSGARPTREHDQLYGHD